MIKRFKFSDIYNKNNITLIDNEIHVWIIKINESKNWSLEQQKYLTKQEHRDIGKYKFEEDRNRALVSKTVLMELLSHYTNTKYMDLNIMRNMYGKPYVKSSDIRYNISHSGQVIMIGFGRCTALGVDIEIIRHIDGYKKLAQNLYAEEEYMAIQSLEEFFRYWTKKEAYLKALGTGLNKNLNSFTIIDNEIIDGRKCLKNWCVEEVKISKDYIAHIAINF